MGVISVSMASKYAPLGAPLVSLQIPTYPVSPPTGGEALGRLSWDQPEMVKYVLNTPITAYVEMYNPTAETKLYCIAYYFLSPTGTLVEEGILTFQADSAQFQAFYLPPRAPEPAFTTATFSASEYDYTFGLRMLLLELTDSVARVIQECSRVQVMLASEETYKKHYGPSIWDFLPMEPDKGPPLPRLLGIYWPWYKQ